MNLAKLKAEITRLNDSDLQEVAACVHLARKTRDPHWLERVTRINATMDAGRENGEKELLRVHENTRQEGR